MGERILRRPINRRTVLKAATGAAAGFSAWGLPGKSYQRARAQDDVLTQILAIPGAGGQPTEADMEQVGELCLRSTKQGAFAGQTVTLHRPQQRRVPQQHFPADVASLGGIHRRNDPWIDVPQAEIFPKVQQSLATGEIEFDIAEGGAPWEGDLLGRGHGSAMPDWVKEQIEIDDYVKLLQAPVGTWDGVTYRISIDGDCHNLNFRSDVFSNADLAAEWTASGGEGDWGPPTSWPQVQAHTKFLHGKQVDGTDAYGYIDVVKPGGGFSWYFYASRATAYAKSPDSPAWLFDPETMKPYINNPAFARAVQEMVDVHRVPSRRTRSTPTC